MPENLLINNECENLVDLLRFRAIKQPDSIAFSFALDSTNEIVITYAELDKKAMSIASVLQNQGLLGERALLLYPPGLEYITAFFGCLYAGVVAVPIYPPRANQNIFRLNSILTDSQARIALTTEKVYNSISHGGASNSEFEGLSWLKTEIITEDKSKDWKAPNIDGSNLAFIQYTSGSTDLPKGVMLSHKNLLNNLKGILDSFECSPKSQGVIWLPPYHDMGLIGGILTPIYGGFPTLLMSPVDFLQSPFRWLQAISDNKATLSGGPNFAFELCIATITKEQKKLLDLSSWEVAFNGAEPIRHDTLERFIEAFSSCGLRKEIFYPCYGLAESTLFVTGGKKELPPNIKWINREELKKNNVIEDSSKKDLKAVQAIVSTGFPAKDTKVKIVDLKTKEIVTENKVGEIWISGPSVAKGYWNNEEQTNESFKALLSNEEKDEFLRTGDLGFLSDGQLYITGRLKDLIIIRGKNYYPNDIERTVDHSHQSLRVGFGAAIAVNNGKEENLVIVQEVERRYRRNLDIEAVTASIRKAVMAEHGLSIHQVILLKTGSIPKTSSGKVQRHACKTAFIEGDLKTIDSRSPQKESKAEVKDFTNYSISRNEIMLNSQKERKKIIFTILLEHVTEILKIQKQHFDENTPLNEIGIDSFTSVLLINRIEYTLGVTFSISNILEGATIEALTEIALAKIENNENIANLTKENESSLHPLSYAQRSLWFLQQLDKNNVAYNIPFAMKIDTSVNIEALKIAVSKLVDLHPVLRTEYLETNKEPMQRINQKSNIIVEEINAEQWSDLELNNKIVALSSQPFNLLTDQIMRIHLFKKCDEYVFLVTVHHIAVDYWSLKKMFKDLWELYEIQVTGSSLILQKENYNFIDYVKFQGKILNSEKGKKLESYWLNQLSGEIPVLNLPTDRKRPVVQTYIGSSFNFDIEKDLSQKLKDFASSENVTLYTLLISAFQILLHRYSNQKDILVGSPTFNRNHYAFENTVGYFTNPVVLKGDFSEPITTRAFLKKMKNTVTEALEHQEYPFSLIVKKLQLERTSSHSPIFQAMFVMEKTNESKQLDSFFAGEKNIVIKTNGLEIVSYPIEKQSSQFDLTLMMIEAENKIFASMEYNSDLFDFSTIERMSKHLLTLLTDLVNRPDEFISDLSLITKDEQLILNDWQIKKGNYEFNHTLHQLFERQAEKTPNNVALSFESQSITYRELNEKANQLAHRLYINGAKPEVIVGVYMERSLEMVISILGILKSGAAYMPLDPAIPEDRLLYMLEDSAASILLTKKNLLKKLKFNRRMTTIVVDEDLEEILLEKTNNLNVNVHSNDLAYLIYTSGSTGLPKGVLNEHQGIVNRLVWGSKKFQLKEKDVVLQKTSFSFDVSIWEIFWPLTVGAHLVIARPEGEKDVDYLISIIKEEKITTLHFVPSMLQVFLEASRIEDLTSVRHVFTSGEALSVKVQNRFFERIDSKLYNLYGPTEAAIEVTWWECKKEESITTVPIGYPIDNTEIHILDRKNNPVPIGVPGELHIGGVAVARGYLNKPVLTEEKFIKNPFNLEPNSRLYKSGDIARFLSNGSIEYLGRIDDQVKIRGYRIELGEVESVLVEHEYVKKAVVIARESINKGNNVLIAYLVSTDVKDLHSIIEHAKRKLPDYMIPVHFVFLEKMPIMINGKVDRKSLPEPKFEVEEKYVRPRNEIETILTHIWEEELGINKIGINDNFFNAGGHSLLATQIIFQIRELFEIELPLREFFKYPTIAGLANVIETAKIIKKEVPIQKIKTISANETFPLSFAQQRLWFLEGYMDSTAVYNVPGAIRIKGCLNIEILEKSLQALVDRHDSLRTVFFDIKGQPRQKVLQKVNIQVEQTSLDYLPSHKRKNKLEEILVQEAQVSFNLSNPPLLRAKLIKVDHDDYTLAITIHHIISDGWSLGIVIKELSLLYKSQLTKKEILLPELPLSYIDFSQWQQDHLLYGDGAEKNLNYWKNQLGGVLPVLQLPIDYQRPNVQSFKGQTYGFKISNQLTQRLLELGEKESASLYMILLASYNVLLNRYTNQDDILVGSPVANRNRKGIENIVGMFVNTIVLRTDLKGSPTFLDLLRRVKKVSLEAFEHQDLPFEKIVEVLQPDRNPTYSPIFQTMFVLQNTPTATLDLPNLNVDLMNIESGKSKYDLTLTIEETKTGLKAYFEYCTSIFDELTIETMSKHFINLLENIILAPHKEIGLLPMLNSEEIENVVYEWNDTFAEYPRDTCLHQLFEQQAIKTPNAVAVNCGISQLTFQELNEKANTLAQKLQSEGYKKGEYIGIFMERSLNLVVGILAVLKTGCAYLPLDPHHPQDRLMYILEDAKVKVVLTDQVLHEKLKKENLSKICVNVNDEFFSYSKYPNIKSNVNPNDPAYVIYTSGSTGQPKGVVVHHRGAVNYLSWAKETYSTKNGKGSVVHSSIGFDLTITSLFLPLITGTTVNLLSEDVSIQALSNFLRKEGNTGLLKITPAHLQLLTLEFNPNEIEDLVQILVIGGEALNEENVAFWKKNSPNTRIFNEYGPTETVVGCSFYEIFPNENFNAAIPIGRPIANTQIYLLNQQLQPVPIGAIGEIYIGGDSVAIGYLNKPDLTDKSFIANPFRKQNQNRLYRSGDLARYRKDGTIEYLGRSDDQVKIRGYRIELGEVQKALNEHSMINDSVLIIKEDNHKNKYIIAYIVSKESILTTNELQKFLKRTLPNYMIPSNFIFLNEIPLSNNGKVNRKALEEFDTKEIGNREFIAPSNELEEKVANVWSEVLNIDKVSITDNFFEIGGHSLLATQVISRINHMFSIKMELRKLFESPTVKDVSQLILEILLDDVESISEDEANLKLER